MSKRRIPETQGRAAVATALHVLDAGEEQDRTVLATAVRYLLEELAELRPGRTVEVRVPPFGAVQCIEGPRHTRGTPPNVIELEALSWLKLATGRLTWQDAISSHQVVASGSRATLEDCLPIY